MSIESPQKCCTHCGGINGYSYSRIERFSVQGDWDWHEAAEPVKVERETKPRCDDCNKVVVVYE